MHRRGARSLAVGLGLVLALVIVPGWPGGHGAQRPDTPAAGVSLVLELADELRLTYGQREELEQLEDDYRKQRLSREETERRLRAVLSDYQVMRYERLRAYGIN